MDSAKADLLGSFDDHNKQFVFEDYLIFGSMLVISTLIGIYFAIKDKLSTGAEKFFTANGELGVVPVALSMLASFLSSITLIGQPAESFLYGSQLFYFGISVFVVIPIVGYKFAPFFQEKKYMSAYQYFGERFSKNLQFISSLLFTVQMVLYLALVLYAPALAIHKVTGVNTMLIVSIMYFVCIFYTTIGGMKAVVWTDSFQVVVLYTAMFAILIKGTIDVGGFHVVWERNAQYNRTNFFNWNFNPTVRYSTWSAFVGSAFLHISFYGGNQLKIQRYLTVKTPEKARQMLWINTIGWTLVIFLTVYAGFLIFARYVTCDPFKSNRVSTADELFPLYVMETFHSLPGFPGLFLAGVFSAGLSTVSAGVNSLAALWINEMRGSLMTNEMWDKRSGTIAKILSFTFGMLSFLFVFLVPYLGGLAPVAISLSGIFTGSLFGIFCLGMFSRTANNVGAMSGLLCSITVLLWLATGSVIFSSPSKDVYSKLNIPTTGCDNSSILFTPKSTYEKPSEENGKFSLYRISFLWYPMLACTLTVVIGMVVSTITNRYSFCNIRKPLKMKEIISEPNGIRLKDLTSNDENDVDASEPFLR